MDFRVFAPSLDCLFSPIESLLDISRFMLLERLPLGILRLLLFLADEEAMVVGL